MTVQNHFMKGAVETQRSTGILMNQNPSGGGYWQLCDMPWTPTGHSTTILSKNRLHKTAVKEL